MRRDQMAPDAGLTTDIGGGYSLDPDAELADSGVTAGSYGMAASVPVFTVDAKGRISTAANVAIAITQGQVTGLTAGLALKAPLASPALTGIPTAPTAAPGTNSTQISSTAFVVAAIAALVASSPATLDTLNELAVALGNDPNFATTMATALGLKAPRANPTFTGTVTMATLAAAAASLTGTLTLNPGTGSNAIAIQTTGGVASWYVSIPAINKLQFWNVNWGTVLTLDGVLGGIQTGYITATTITPSGNVVFGGASGNTLKYNTPVANAAVATTLGSVGPTGSTAGNPQGWIRINIAGTDRYMPYW